MGEYFRGVTQEYFYKLVEQYQASTGTKHVDLESGDFIKEFSEWVQSRKLMGTQYGRFLDWMEVHPEFDSCSIEIGKGKEDSIVLGTGMSMITPYSEGIEGVRVEKGNFELWSGRPIVVRGNNALYLNMGNITRIFTQNPYSQDNIRNWELIHNSGYNITVGVFGSTDDKDINEKLGQVESLKEKMEPGYAEEYVTDQGLYYYAVSSARKVKVNILTR